MNPNQQLIEEFYAAFASHNPDTMASCYHPDVIFQDPVFGILKGKDVSDMWHMLIERSKGNLEIEFSQIIAEGHSGSAVWVAKYTFSSTNRNVVNVIHAQFEFRDGLIFRHTDHFKIWKWSQQALGFKGFLLGWTGFLQNKIQQQALHSLRKYQSGKS
ncbi:nuclear transport factor 2 family protein [Flavobacterium pallidum]|uniref:Nuclear transport factor 2 family protein n=1 Tax=Flavobacterium pallidum TaxID=2172098 RepID=A0A2S1SJI1_9FLAO|nr:nuclear transport factor 2 family protein [Flavobacterium pallidum]AWI26541.1 nuclear transport factor 2 family protein [Flavobacterium pallidum]